MKRFILIIVIVGGVYQFWNKNEEDMQFQSTPSPYGFVEVVMPSGTKKDTVYIMAPQNCPKKAGQRADALERELKRLDVPVERSSNGSVNTHNMSEEEQNKFRNSVSILNGEIPAVFINGMAKANPGIDEIVAEYHRVN